MTQKSVVEGMEIGGYSSRDLGGLRKRRENENDRKNADNKPD